MKLFICWWGVIFLCVSVTRAETRTDSVAVLGGGENNQKKQGVVGTFLADEAAIWTSPLHMDGDDALYWGGVVATTAALISIDQPVARTAYKFRDDHVWVQSVSPVLTQFGQFYVPYGIAAAYCVEGIAFNDDTRVDTGLLAVQAMIHSGIVVQVIKHISGRSRPFVTFDRDKWYGPRMIFQLNPPRGYSPYDSFPSGHTITAFTLATVIAGREQSWVGYVAYSCAGLCGLSRLTQHDHWLSDVFVGGTLGVAIGKLELLRHDQPLAIYPSIGSGSAGLTLQFNK
jgi:membrane-associated phospholipid phosphatase